jgi:hypothetical protein
MEIRRTKIPKKHPVRIELEHAVIAWNKYLSGVVSKMGNILLLRNVNPSIRSDYAYRLKEAGLISPEDVKEFTRKVEISNKMKRLYV